MTLRANQIQSMIADIDKLLAHKGKRLWGVISSSDEPREVLQRVRDFLVSEAEASDNNSSPAQLPPLVAKFMEEGIDNEESQQPQYNNNLLSELIQPLKLEIKTLSEERANLVSEIRELEKKRQHDYSLAQQLASQEKIISEFMQVLSSRLEDGIVVGNSYASVDKGSNNTTTRKALPASSDRGDSGQVENLTKLTNDLDQRLVALDGTVNVVFEALQRNIHAYHDSLSQALSRMHYKGVQGEQLLESFIKNVANLSPAQGNSEFIKQATDDITVETIDATSVESTQIDNQLKQDFETVESSETESAQFNQDNDNLVTLDETIDNIEFSQAQQSLDNSSTTSSDLKTSQQEDTVSENLSEESNQRLDSDNSISNSISENLNSEDLNEGSNLQLEQENYLEVEFPEETEETEEVIPSEPDAFDSPDKMQAVLTELKKSTSEEELPAETSSDNEDEVDELYASLFDSDISTTSTSNTQPPQQVITQAINVENLPTSPATSAAPSTPTSAHTSTPTSPATSAETDSQLQQTQEEKEVVSEEVVFEYVPSPSTPTQEPPLTDPWNGDKKALAPDSESEAKSAQNPPQLNQAVAKTYKRKQAASEDTITTLTELLFEEAPPEVASPEVAALEAPTPEEETATPEAQQEVAAQEEITTPEVQPNQPEAFIQPKHKPQLQEITLPVTSLRQPDRNPDKNKQVTTETIAQTTTTTNKLDTPLPQTEKTVAPLEEKSQDNSSYVTSTEIPSINPNHTVWYLGLDIGTTGISAALLNRSTTEIHPVYWAQENQADQNRNFRLPAEVYLPKTSISPDKGENPTEQNIYSAYLKPYLPISLAYKSVSETASSEFRQKWEPILQLNEFSAVPLVWIIRSLSKLLLTLKSDTNSTTLGLTATAIGIEKEQFSDIINKISGIICTCPSDWSEQYRFNIRESLIISGLVEHPQQVFFVEEAIASLLGELEGASGETVKLVQHENSAPKVTSDRHLTGNTLAINIGAGATEMALVDIPEDLQDLSHGEFMLHGFTCGGKAMEQDIITQLLLPSKWRKSRSQSNDANTDNNPLHWKPSIPGLDQIRFTSLGLEQLELPRAGEPDISQRIQLQQRLESSPLGKALLDAAIALKLILQHQESFLIELSDQRWELQRRDLESQVFVPFVRRINRELNKLLVARGIPTEAINQIILSGGVSSINAISRWLQQKLPSAKIIQEKYLGENGTPATSRVAQGLCLLPLHPLVLEIPRQQYTDYFLFTELLRLIPEKATTFGEVIQLFESRGINTRTCQQRLLAFLEGEIPPGLVPNSQDMQWLNKSSVQNGNYKSISASPLFDKQGSLSYRPNLRQLQHLRNYLEAIKASAHQSLEEPYTVNFAVGVRE